MIGEFLVSINAITEAQCQEILAVQDKEPEKLFGEIAIELGYINDDAIDKYLASKAD